MEEGRGDSLTGGQLSSSPTPPPSVREGSPLASSSEEAARMGGSPSIEGGKQDGGESEEESAFAIPSIDVEVNITINVDSGIIVLRSEVRYMHSVR